VQVYGDNACRADAGEALDEILRQADALAAAPAGLGWHGGCAALLIELGCLLQGVADRDFAELGHDEETATARALMDGLIAIAAALRRSWRSALGEQMVPRLAGLRALRLSGEVTLNRPEGYAFYALYPEAYLTAATGLPAGAVVIGLRSIGTGLAALVAEASGAARALTVRPQGSPFDRTIVAGAALEAEIAGLRDRWFVIADEGPGLSGSSFLGTAGWLESLGVTPGRIVFMPSHPGRPRGEAGEARQRRWAGAPRRFASFEDVLLGPASPAPLAGWFADLTGPPLAPLRELSGGAWAAGTANPRDPGREARKFLLETERGQFRLKFIGLDRAAAGKLARAEVLHAAGFCPRPLCLRHGFLIEEQIDACVAASVPVERLADYLAFRARAFPAERAGASLAELAEMASANLAEADPTLDLSEWRAWATAQASALQALCRPIYLDARLHRWEWLDRAGTALKTDALDHAEAHDLVGCQDIAWDVAGAVIEHDLDARDQALLAERVLGQRPGAGDLLRLMTYCYLGFQTGWWSFSTSAAGRERGRWYAARAARFLAGA
jgi:hypothetical protein